jgi:hypothetical protein
MPRVKVPCGQSFPLKLTRKFVIECGSPLGQRHTDEMNNVIRIAIDIFF